MSKVFSSSSFESESMLDSLDESKINPLTPVPINEEIISKSEVKSEKDEKEVS